MREVAIAFFVCLILLLLTQYAYPDVTADTVAKIISADVPEEVIQGGAASINWVLAIVATFSSAGFIYTIMILIKELRSKAQDNREGWLLLKEARQVIAQNNNHHERNIEIMRRVERILESTSDA